MKKQNGQKRQRRILLSLLMIALTGIVLSTSTYAWFTANKTVTVSDITVNVASSNGVQVSVDGITWKTVISNDDIVGASATYAAAVNQLPSETNNLSPVSTIGEIDTTEGDTQGFLKMFTGTIESNAGGNYILTTARSTETNGTGGNFIAFDLFLQVTEDTQVYLTPNSRVSASGEGSGIENAARIAFVVEGNTPVGSSTATIQGLKASLGTEEVVIWETNNDSHTSAAVSNAASNYGVTGLTAGAGNTPVAYRGVKAEITAADDIALNSNDATFFTSITPNISTTTAGISAASHEELIELAKGITKVRVYMWVEGQDVDCENNASGGSVVYSLQISSNATSN